MLVLGYARSLLEEPAPFIRLVAQDRLDHLQFDDRIRICAHAGIHEQVENVFQPARDFIEKILTLA